MIMAAIIKEESICTPYVMIAERFAGVNAPYTTSPFAETLPFSITIFAPKKVIRSEAVYIASIITGELSAMIFSALVKSFLTSPAALSNFFFS